MKTLPKYYCIKRDESNPLWKKYIDWFNKVSGDEWAFSAFEYSGYEGNYNLYHWIESFENNPELITLEFWDECVNGRKIVGYNPPYELFGGIIKTNDRYVKCGTGYTCLRLSGYALPSQVVEAYFTPFYEEEKLEVDRFYYGVETTTMVFKGKLTQEKVDKIKEVINE